MCQNWTFQDNFTGYNKFLEVCSILPYNLTNFDLLKKKLNNLTDTNELRLKIPQSLILQLKI